MTTYTGYEEATADYLAQFQTMRGGSERAVPSATHLVESAAAIADISATMLPLGEGYLADANPVVRVGMSNQLLAQAAAELQVATTLLQIAEKGEQVGETAVTRAGGSAELRRAITDLEEVMSKSLDAPFTFRTARSVGVATTVEEAKAALSQQAIKAVDTIALSIQELGGDIAFDLLMQSEWAAIVEGGSLLHKDIGELLEKVKDGAGELLGRALRTAYKTILNVYDKLLALLGKDLEDQARQQVKGWLEEVGDKQKIDLFEVMITKLYETEAFKAEIPKWLAEADVELGKLNGTVTAVSTLTDGFLALEKRLKGLQQALVLAKMLKQPQILLIIAGLQVTLLATVVYTGADYVGYRELRFPNFTTGVGELLRQNLQAGTESLPASSS